MLIRFAESLNPLRGDRKAVPLDEENRELPSERTIGDSASGAEANLRSFGPDADFS
jgi:hypothetical protein